MTSFQCRVWHLRDPTDALLEPDSTQEHLHIGARAARRSHAARASASFQSLNESSRAPRGRRGAQLGSAGVGALSLGAEALPNPAAALPAAPSRRTRRSSYFTESDRLHASTRSCLQRPAPEGPGCVPIGGRDFSVLHTGALVNSPRYQSTSTVGQLHRVFKFQERVRWLR
ncbi:hypothetical protein AOLI_G00252190 [Acnodon oligacanthus]